MKAISINIGVNAPPFRCGTSGVLKYAEASAQTLADFAKEIGFAVEDPSGKVQIGALTAAEATSTNVVSALEFARAELEVDGILLLSFAGHGCQVRDSPPYDERDHLDETWCLHDRQFRDDEVMEQLRRFGAGIRILLVSDSCHSGGFPSIPQELFLSATDAIAEAERRILNWARRPDCFTRPRRFPDLGLKASVLLLASSPEDKTCEDGIFMGALMAALKQGGPKNYCELRDQIHHRMNLVTPFPPLLDLFGAPDLTFPRQPPFTI